MEQSSHKILAVTKMYRIRFVILTWTLLYGLAQGAADCDLGKNLEKHLTETFNVKRSCAQETAKEQVRQTIREFFNDLKNQSSSHIDIEEQPFTQQIGTLCGVSVDATNIILIMKGENWGTQNDAISVLGAHYDSQLNTPGVDDNGSGMASLMETARLMTKLLPLKNSIIFVAFDLEEGGLYGSEQFVNNFLIPNLFQKYSINANTFQGAIILETILNYDDSPNSQSIPVAFSIALPHLVDILNKDQNRGNFLLCMNRQDDQALADMVRANWALVSAEKDSGLGKFLNVTLPFSGRPSALDISIRGALSDAWRSDHYDFWDASTSASGLKALFITDSANYRGYMQQCYHEPCDDVDKITGDRIKFLSRTTVVMLQTLYQMATGEQLDPDTGDCPTIGGGIQAAPTAMVLVSSLFLGLLGYSLH